MLGTIDEVPITQASLPHGACYMLVGVTHLGKEGGFHCAPGAMCIVRRVWSVKRRVISATYPVCNQLLELQYPFG